jgi:hypothetical protein
MAALNDVLNGRHANNAPSFEVRDPVAFALPRSLQTKKNANSTLLLALFDWKS